MISVNDMTKRVAGLLDGDELSEWERDFMHNVWLRSDKGRHTSVLSEKQVEMIERIYKKYFPTRNS
jgi:hypothetical protein